MKTNKTPKKTTDQFKFFEPVEKNGWIVQISTMEDVYILTTIRSKITGQTIIRHFDDEQVAASFVDFVCEQEPEEEHDI